MKPLAIILLGLMPFPADALYGQGRPWLVTGELQASVVTPTRNLGPSGVTNARVRGGPGIGGSVRFRRSGSPVGLYLGTVQALQGGFRAWPTAACQIGCRSTTVDHGRFWTLTGGATVQWDIGRVATTVRLGGGLRSYSLYGADIVSSVPQPGEFWTARFMGVSTNGAVHTGIHVSWPVGDNQLFASLEDFIAGSDYDRTFNDLVISIGIHLR